VGQAGEEIRGHAVERAVGQGRRHPGLVAPDPDDVAGEPGRPGGLGNGTPEQSHADDGETLDHAPLFPSTVRSALSSFLFSSGVPMVMRKAVSIPKEVSGRTITPRCSSFW